MQAHKSSNDSRHVDLFECLNCDTTIRIAKPTGKSPQDN